jgi:hypothetical protein
MAVRSLRDTARPALDNHGPFARPSSVAETILIYHEDIPPLPPLKDAKYWNISRQPPSFASLCVFKNNNMCSSTTIYKCDKNYYPSRHDSLLDSPLGCYSHPKVKESLSPFVALDSESPGARLDTYCSSRSSSLTCSAVAQRQTLLPPFPRESLSSSGEIVDGQSLYPSTPWPLAARPGDPPMWMPAFESPSKRGITPLELERLRHAPLPARLYNRCRTTSPTSGLDLSHTGTIVSSSPLTSTGATLSTLDSTMSSLTTSQTPSLPTTSALSFSALTRNDSRRQRRRKIHKPANIIPPGSLPTTLHRRDISLPLDTQSTSPIEPNFDLGLPSHDFMTGRQSPIPPTADASVSTPPLSSACTASLGTPTSQSSVQPLLSPFQEQPIETSAFDSDTDNERRPSHAKNFYKKVSRPLLKPSRTRAETIPSASTRNHSKGASISKRISKQDIRSPASCSSDTSDDPAGCGITMVRMSTSSTASPIDTRSSGTTIAPATLRKIISNREPPTSKSKRTSDMIDSSEKSSPSSRTTNSHVGGIVTGRRRTTSSSERVRSWFSRVFAKRNTL